MYISVQENFLIAYADFLECYVHLFEHFHDFRKHTNFIFYLGIVFYPTSYYEKFQTYRKVKIIAQ